MNNNNRAFTLVELMIVIAILSIMSGVVSKLWYGMEKQVKRSGQRATITMSAQDVILTLRKEVRHSISMALDEGTGELALEQITADGVMRTVRFFSENNEYLRETQTGESTSVMKVTGLPSEKINMHLHNDEFLVVEIDIPRKQEPTQNYERTFKAMIPVPGGVQ